MKILVQKNLTSEKIEKYLVRPSVESNQVSKVVSAIISDIKTTGKKSLIKYSKKYDRLNKEEILVSKKKINDATNRINPELKEAINQAAKNIKKFHIPQKPKQYQTETMKGVFCSRKFIPIENVGLYVPGGSAVLFSTMLMLGIPAKIAGSKRIVVCSPIGESGIDPALAYALKIIGANEFYSVGGAQAIAMMAYGVEGIKKVDKIFGPGNQFVTTAKTLVSIDPDGCAIDMPAGPSEVLIIADETGNPSYVAADLLSQAEHGADSQVVLLTTSLRFASNVKSEIKVQLKKLQRKEIAKKSLAKSIIVVVKDILTAIEISNKYAPEHLILSTKNNNELVKMVRNAGSVFIGNYSPESVGDYASGTNHSLPTYGYAKSFSGVSVDSFMKAITFQKLSKSGLKNISDIVIKMAEAEKLDAHSNAVKIRLKK